MTTSPERFVLAIDIGGTKFAAALVDADGNLRERWEVPTGTDPTATLTDLVERAQPWAPISVGIGAAGPIDLSDGSVSPVNIPAWPRFPLVATVADMLDGVPVSLAGDAQCMALGEWWKGGYAQSPALLGIVVSTGIGGGLILDGAPYLGPTGNAAHIGHILVDTAGQRCPCGAIGCLETVASGPSMVRWALAQGWRCTGAADGRALAASAAAGDPVALAAFTRAADALAIGIRTTAALCDLDDVVLGGGVAAAGDLLLDPLSTALRESPGLDFLRRVRVGITRLHRDAGLYGAAALAWRRPSTVGSVATAAYH